MNRRAFTYLVWSTAALIGAGGASAHLAGVRLNLSASAPQGLWRVEATPVAAVERGTTVSICPPAAPVVVAMRDAGHLPPGQCASGTAPLLKPVAAIAGDLVTVAGDGPVLVNGEPIANTAPIAGIPSWAPGTYTVAPGQIWLLSSYAAGSFDSRYFGPVPVAEVQGRARALWTRGDHAAMTPTRQGDL